jgi:hypothetical protein
MNGAGDPALLTDSRLEVLLIVCEHATWLGPPDLAAGRRIIGL